MNGESSNNRITIYQFQNESLMSIKYTPPGEVLQNHIDILRDGDV